MNRKERKERAGQGRRLSQAGLAGWFLNEDEGRQTGGKWAASRGASHAAWSPKVQATQWLLPSGYSPVGFYPAATALTQWLPYLDNLTPSTLPALNVCRRRPSASFGCDGSIYGAALQCRSGSSVQRGAPHA